ncbi:MAG TPA: hypothetical protein VI316_08500 [Candidatus Dormibacteraeota bacterium]
MHAVLAHVVSSGTGPGLVAWVPAGVVFIGAAVVGFAPRGYRRLGGGLAGMGVAGLVVVNVLAASPPASPGYAIRVLTPAPDASVTSPVLLTVCATTPNGAPVDVPGPGRVLSVFIDGRQTLESTTSSHGVFVNRGPHAVRVEVLTSDHREFSPVIDTTVHVVVTGGGPLPAAIACPR